MIEANETAASEQERLQALTVTLSDIESELLRRKIDTFEVDPDEDDDDDTVEVEI